MGLKVDEKDLELIEEVGYKVSSVDSEGGDIRIRISTPDKTDRTRVLTLPIEKAEIIEYIKDGNVYREPEALKRAKQLVKRDLEKVEKTYDYDFENYDILKNKDKIREACEEYR